jgi:predicted helicase
VAEDVKEMVPVTNPFLKEMLETFLHAGGRRRGIDFDELGVQEVVEALRSEETDLPAILRDFNNRAEGEDPVIRFYEDFLEAYDKALKVQRGVFYTPKPVVSYIVRGVHELLQTEFGLEDGLASTVTWGEMARLHPEIRVPQGVSPDSFFVMILDPATGTATFLVEVIDVIYKTMSAKWKREGKNAAQIQAAWNEYVPQALLPRLYGYELMMAPYAIAHMKIGLKLFETGYRFASDQRANIYLTNALEEPSQLAEGSAASLFEALGHEAQAVNAVKRDVRFTVVIGNPPYSVSSQNKSDYIENLVEVYKIAVRNEQNIQPLSDDYIKFIRYDQMSIEQSDAGIVALITNNAFLSGLIHRGIRGVLLSTFNKLIILNLRGNLTTDTKVFPKDQNVFDIKQGVSIAFLIKSRKPKEKAKYFEVFGNRSEKYNFLNSNNILSFEWEDLNPSEPNLFLVPKDFSLDQEYTSYISTTDLFIKFGTGSETRKDNLWVAFTKEELDNRLDFFVDKKISANEIENSLGISSTDYWNLPDIRNVVRKTEVAQYYQRVVYRPFDRRVIYYNPQVIPRGSHSFPLMRHMLSENLCIIANRQISVPTICHFFVANGLVDRHIFETAHAGMQCFPLYLYSYSGDKVTIDLFSQIESKQERTPNISSKFVRVVSERFGLSFLQSGKGDLVNTYGPEDLLNYIYAIFYSPTYRRRYAEFLKIDFPRLPLTSNIELFRQLCGLGADLVALHLLEAEYPHASWRKAGAPAPFSSPITRFVGAGDKVVAKGYPKYQAGKVWINPAQGFAGVPEEVWEFHIGGYQVCEKWLKDRRGRQLSAEDVAHYQKVVVALKETIRLMAEVDEAIESHGGWPIR